MDREWLARECLRVERAGCSVREFLGMLGCISPWGTWYRLQREELGRKLWEIHDGKGVTVMASITTEQREEAIEIMLSGKSPLPFLRECGSMKPGVAWQNIKRQLEKDEPERYARLMAISPVPVELAELEKEGINPVKINSKNEKTIRAEDLVKSQNVNEAAISAPIFYETLHVSALRDDMIGEFYYDAKYGTLDWRAPDGAEVSVDTAIWRTLMEKLPGVMKVLGI